MTEVLEQNGIKVNRKRVVRFMRIMNLCPKVTNYKYKRYHQNNIKEEHANLLNQMFKANDRNKIWVGDITYIPTQKKILYLAVFIDIFLHKVVGCSMDTRMKDKLVIATFN